MSTNRNGNRVHEHGQDRTPKPCKVPADSVPYGASISTHGRYVWAIYVNDTLVAVGATADEARRKYRAKSRG